MDEYKIRYARAFDCHAMKLINEACLPENYSMNFYYQHMKYYPDLNYVATDSNGKIVGYVMAFLQLKKNAQNDDWDEEEHKARHKRDIQKRKEEQQNKHNKSQTQQSNVEEIDEFGGHITSFAVLPEYRGHKIGQRLMASTLVAMKKRGASDCSLNVRVSNEIPIHLYRDRFGFEVDFTDEGYYEDGEDAYYMVKKL